MLVHTSFHLKACNVEFKGIPGLDELILVSGLGGNRSAIGGTPRGDESGVAIRGGWEGNDGAHIGLAGEVVDGYLGSDGGVLKILYAQVACGASSTPSNDHGGHIGIEGNGCGGLVVEGDEIALHVLSAQERLHIVDALMR